MYARVGISREGRGFALRISAVQFDLIRRVALTFLDIPRADPVVALMVGASPVGIFSAIEVAESPDARGNVRLVLSEEQLHSIYAVLASAYLHSNSEESFYVRCGFFRENVKELAGGITAALGELQHDAG